MEGHSDIAATNIPFETIMKRLKNLPTADEERQERRAAEDRAYYELFLKARGRA